ncbi:MAG: hypothetical protein II135_05235 [Clostridia bacterium]|nr:hypothetical protein [Clostridia bacterium]
MKKFAAIAIAATMIAALFAFSASAMSVTVSWYDSTVTEGSTFQFVGWAIIDEEIDDFGYRIDDQDPVFGYLQERSAEIVSVMGSDPAKTNGFNVTISAANVPAGEHTLHIVVKGKSGAVADVPTHEGVESFTIVGTGSETPASASLLNKSFDTIFVDGEKLIDGKADSWLTENEIKGEIDAIEVRGWAHVSTAITAFAYTIDGGKAVKSADFIQDRPDVKAAINPDAEGFDFTIDVSNTGVGAHTIRIYAVDVDGNLVDTTYEVPFTQEKEAAIPQTPTSDAAIIAIAAVGCVALAGAVIAKKAK